MKEKLTTVLLLTCAMGLFADQVILKNQDRVTGKVIKKDADKLTFKSDHFGEITIPWEQVQELRTDDPVTVVSTSGAESKTVLTATEPPLQNIKALRNSAEQREWERRLHPSWLELWTGTATIGFAGAQGNAQTRTLNAALVASRITRTDKASISFAAIRSKALVAPVESTTAQAVRGGWSYDHNVSRRVFFTGFNDYEYDRFQNLDLRFVLGGGAGYIAWQKDTGRLDLLAGVAYDRERFSPPASQSFTRSSAEAYVGNQLTYPLTRTTSLVQSFRVFPNLSNTGLYRFNFDMAANTRLFKWLLWNFAVSDRFLSQPIPGRKQNDLLWTLGLGIGFSH